MFKNFKFLFLLSSCFCFLSITSPVKAESGMSQVTNVNQLSDVQPTDWAFQALQSLVERYGCIAGYPNGTFRGNRAMTRYEFAAGLNACLD
ncbi:MAG: iron uptake porin, partial [Rivularia sp. (in: cyanobacteria)]